MLSSFQLNLIWPIHIYVECVDQNVNQHDQQQCGPSFILLIIVAPTHVTRRYRWACFNKAIFNVFVALVSWFSRSCCAQSLFAHHPHPWHLARNSSHVSHAIIRSPSPICMYLMHYLQIGILAEPHDVPIKVKEATISLLSTGRSSKITQARKQKLSSVCLCH